jgi:anti-sigma B factor antagonist
MTHERPPVALVQVPQAINARQERIFLSELESFMSSGRPRIVLDCSKLRQMDKAAIHLLLCCLELALKRNGDVKLAAIPREASAAFGLFGLEGLFEVFDTTSSAAESFHRVPKSGASHSDEHRISHTSLSNGE